MTYESESECATHYTTAPHDYIPPTDINNVQLVKVAPSTTTTTSVTHLAENAATLYSARTILSERSDVCTQNLIANGLSKLKYVPVHIQGID